MAAVMWIEVLARDGGVQARERIDAEEARIGRAFDNDVVVDDPHVAPHHVRIARGEDGGLYAEDLGTLNGLFTEHGEARLQRVALSQAPGLRIGRTVLRVHDGIREVAPEKPLRPPRADLRWSLGLGMAFFALILLFAWLATTTEISASRLVLPLLGAAVGVALWAGFWTLLSRIFTGQAHFTAMVRITLSMALAALAWDTLAEWLSFGLAWRELAEVASLGTWALVAATCYAHLRVMGVRRLRVAMGVVLATIGTIVSLQFIGLSEARKTLGQQASLGVLKPPALRVVPGVSVDAFVLGTEPVRRQVDEARKKEPIGAGLMADMDPDAE
jgi:hypothetical protein